MKYFNKKELINQIITQESKVTDIKVDTLISLKIICLIDAIKEVLKKEKMSKSKKIKSIKEVLEFYKGQYTAYYDDFDNKIRIFLDSLLQESLYNNTLYLYRLTRTIYHEYAHALVHNNNSILSPLEKFYLEIEKYIYLETYNYFYNHDTFYEELYAETYSIEKTTNYLKQEYLNTTIYNKLKPYLELDELLIKLQYNNFDIENNLNFIYELDKQDINLTNNNYNISYLYNKDNLYKNLKDLSQTDKWNKLPLEAQFLIIATKDYLTTIIYEYLSKEELNFLANAIYYSLRLEQTKQENNTNTKTQLVNFNETNITSNEILDMTIDEITECLENYEISNQNKIANLQDELNKILNHLTPKLYSVFSSKEDNENKIEKLKKLSM